MTAVMPVEFTRDVAGHQQRCGNRVVIEDVNGNPAGTGLDTTTFTNAMGEAQDNPAPNTTLDRLKDIQESVVPITASSADVHAPASNTAAVVTYAANTAYRHVISGVAWSYDGTPTGGNLKIEDVSGTTVFTVDITAAGPGFIPFWPLKRGALVNSAMIITLAAGGSGVSGKVSVLGHYLEEA